ncbi:Histidine kinase-, DNA gyrase B-, and HSP90-like ATPase [Winogradskyella jejuensis]|uniref:Histidine kinase-, DNA gyrase B-, and HSP90-like ATPase n=2 Tax=Winogradskyella jejuensis TaxID=1089305 RepID=A0A1M5SUB7_9FLAO|nr:Histidine kinase-, DNA gyrase B-, and HSP90-like ATPase [Winogradskyella jejuensis]
MNTVMKNIKLKELGIIFGFYLFFSILYRIVLWYSANNYESEGFWGWAKLRDYWYMAGMQYVFYFIASIFIWFLGVYLLKNRKKIVQISVVAVLIPIVVYFIRESRYIFLDSIDIWHLGGAGAVWDWYIPTLFMMIQFGCFFAYRYFKENQQKLKVEGELKTVALKSELSALKAQLNPHFLYNIFNTISASVPPENEKTRHLIAELSDLFRYQLKASKVEKVPLREELEFVNKYLDLEKERFQERLKVSINVKENLLDEMVPPMLLQPLVENSVKHGLSSLIEGGEISISIFKKEDKLHFEIADTGIGIENKLSVFDKGIGLTNTKLRLEKMYQTTLNLSDNSPKGLKISFTL